MIRLTLGAFVFAWTLAWYLNRRARRTDAVWETLNALHQVDRVTVYDPKGRRTVRAFRQGDHVTIKEG